MNVQAVGGPVVVPALPAVTRPASAEHSRTAADTKHRDPAAAAAEAQRQSAEKLPPLKPLSTTEMRVILGAIPVNHQLARQNGQGARPEGGSSFDAYA